MKELLEGGINEKTDLNTLKNEHLLRGVNPIMACIGSPDDLGEEFIDLLESGKKSRAVNIDFEENFTYLKGKNFLNGGNYSYILSTISEKDKFSQWFANCLGMVVAGRKNDGNEISFLSHQYPKYFLDQKNKEHFINDLNKRIKEIISDSEKGTIDVVIFGGNYVKKESRELYEKSIEFLSEIIQNKLEFKPVVVVGPKNVSGNDNVYYKNDERKLYILRPQVGDSSSESFLVDEIKTKKEKWDKELVKES